MQLQIKSQISKPKSRKGCSPQEGHCEKRFEIKSGGQEMAVTVG